eukprot:5287732-Prymnesium_polylepis.1
MMNRKAVNNPRRCPMRHARQSEARGKAVNPAAFSAWFGRFTNCVLRLEKRQDARPRPNAQDETDQTC